MNNNKRYVEILCIISLMIWVSIVSSGCTTFTKKGLDSRALHGRVLIEPMTGKMLIVEDIVNSEAYWIHEMMPDGQGLIYHRD
jgi:hypothetical protein